MEVNVKKAIFNNHNVIIYLETYSDNPYCKIIKTYKNDKDRASTLYLDKDMCDSIVEALIEQYHGEADCESN